MGDLIKSAVQVTGTKTPHSVNEVQTVIQSALSELSNIVKTVSNERYNSLGSAHTWFKRAAENFEEGMKSVILVKDGAQKFGLSQIKKVLCDIQSVGMQLTGGMDKLVAFKNGNSQLNSHDLQSVSRLLEEFNPSYLGKKLEGHEALNELFSQMRMAVLGHQHVAADVTKTLAQQKTVINKMVGALDPISHDSSGAIRKTATRFTKFVNTDTLLAKLTDASSELKKLHALVESPEYEKLGDVQNWFKKAALAAERDLLSKIEHLKNSAQTLKDPMQTALCEQKVQNLMKEITKLQKELSGGLETIENLTRENPTNHVRSYSFNGLKSIYQRFSQVCGKNAVIAKQVKMIEAFDLAKEYNKLGKPLSRLPRPVKETLRAMGVMARSRGLEKAGETLLKSASHASKAVVSTVESAAPVLSEAGRYLGKVGGAIGVATSSFELLDSIDRGKDVSSAEKILTSVELGGSAVAIATAGTGVVPLITGGVVAAASVAKEGLKENRVASELLSIFRSGDALDVADKVELFGANLDKLKELDDDGIEKFFSAALKDEQARKNLQDKSIWNNEKTQRLVDKSIKELLSGYITDEDAAIALFLAYQSGNDAYLKEAFERIDRGDEKTYRKMFIAMTPSFDDIKNKYKQIKNNIA